MQVNPYAPPATVSKRRRKWLRPLDIEWFMLVLGLIAIGVAYGVYPLLYLIVRILWQMEPKYEPAMAAVLRTQFIFGAIFASISCGLAISSWILRNLTGGGDEGSH